MFLAVMLVTVADRRLSTCRDPLNGSDSPELGSRLGGGLRERKREFGLVSLI